MRCHLEPRSCLLHRRRSHPLSFCIASAEVGGEDEPLAVGAQVVDEGVTEALPWKRSVRALDVVGSPSWPYLLSKTES